MKRPTKPSIFLCSLSLLTVGLAACEKKPEFPVIEPFSTASWARPLCEGLEIRIATDGSGDLLLMSPSTSADVRQGLGLPAMKDLPVYRYDVKAQRLHVVSSHVWDGDSTDIMICHKQRSLLYPGPFEHDLTQHILHFHDKQVPAAAATVLNSAVSPNREYAAVLSGEGKFKRGGFMPFGDPVISGKRFHQVFRMADAVPVGEPVMLQGTTERNDVRPCWSPDGRFVVYKDGKCEHLWIIEAPITPSEAERK